MASVLPNHPFLGATPALEPAVAKEESTLEKLSAWILVAREIGAMAGRRARPPWGGPPSAA